MYYALALLFALAPTYVIRFNIGKLPANLLELLVAIFLLAFIFWLWKNSLWDEFKLFVKKSPRLLLFAGCLLLLAAAVSVLISPAHQRAAGLFLVQFLMPMLVYYPAAYILANPLNKIRFIKWMLFLIALFSLYGIIQYFTLIGLPREWWGNANEPKRILSIFEYPNAFALYLTPLLAFLLPFVLDKNLKSLWYRFAYILGLIGLLLSLSRGGWAGFAAAVLVYAIFFSSKSAKKIIAVLAIIAALLIVAIPNLRYRVILPFKGEKSTVSRYSLWHTANKMIKDSPIFGKGLYGYRTEFDRYNTDPNITAVDYPHNIFLNFWVETGLLGLIAFLLISAWAILKSIRAKGLVAAGTILFFVALYVHGLADAPYFKNDLALIFWIILAL